MKGTAVMDETPMEARGNPLDFDALVEGEQAALLRECRGVLSEGGGGRPSQQGRYQDPLRHLSPAGIRKATL